MEKNPKPTDIILHQQAHTLELIFDNGERFNLPWEYLRTFSPSKEVRARFGKDRILVLDKQDVVLEQMKPIGNYALKLFFSDGHNSGLYDWRFLYELGVNQEKYWQDHLDRVAQLTTDQSADHS
ncbi:MAG: gamma-butyrobetaine hydroxylase-like domain-containing protein [Sedimenticola sp.]|nr:gamma-butyrobetaine hydroxylase-like domain-containing protein [Sedimenticola sp.]MCW8920360.1 gamma-butyrobetaine hydroxylase-like domain-containing protein [Sedimenticola sp.]MCW8946327.1 gamma-butyrobetaine hydroxylase-like domain-containing protein [Sedimenticola sp.]MDF1529153.1 gamma-butyrobetaine hydroxylase-like domain-containing protein [Sedimenticola sp.]